ncbi:MAG: hypothetical protein EXS37_09255 [Opitutus sp.]|nr:hypothetical protein [Opitutus sp.]
MSVLRSVFLGRARSLSDQKLFHQVSLVALFAWVGLGADGLSSSCYGTEPTWRRKLAVNGFGLALTTFILVSLTVGSVDAGNFKGAAELAALRDHTAAEAERYAAWARTHGFGAATFTTIGHDITGEVMSLAATARAQFPNSVFFAGQLQFVRETRLTRLLHNHTATALQHRFFAENLPFVVLPIRVNSQRG